MSELQSEATDSPIERTLEQKRAAFVLRRLESWREPKNREGGKEYRRIVQRLPAMVLTNGLGQALAFLMSDPDDRTALAVVGDLTAYLVGERGLYSSESPNLVAKIVDGDRETLRRATDETLALLI